MDFALLLNLMPGSIAQGLIWAMAAFGVFLTFRVLDFADLTVDGSFATGAAVAALCITKGMNPFLAVLFAVLSGMIAGFITGMLHTALGIPAILSGILTQFALYSINMRINGNASNRPIDMDLFKIIVTPRDNIKSIYVAGIFVIGIIAVLYWFFGTEIGASLRATGINERMARAQGVNTNVTKVIVLMISNGLVATSGAIYAQYMFNADVNLGRGAIVICLAAIIIGEVIFGRDRNFAVLLTSAAFGSVAYFVIVSFVLWLGLNSNDLKLLTSLTVALFLGIPYILKKRKNIKPKKAVAGGGESDAEN